MGLKGRPEGIGKPVAAVNPRPLIAADVGGTHARVARVEPVAVPATVRLADYRRYDCADFPDLAAILRTFVDEAGIGPQADATVAIAGLLVGDTLVHANLPWSVSVSATVAAAGLNSLRLINDFEAMAWAVPSIDLGRARLVSGPDRTTEPGPALVIGPGTGFGASVRVPGRPPLVVPTEAGHAALSVRSAHELEVLAVFMRRWSHVGNERMLSGPGLLNTYQALCGIDGVAARLQEPAAITAAAQQGCDPQAVEALSMFCNVLGSVAGDLALTFGAKAVYLAGGIPAQIADFLLASDFAARFVDKGVMGEVLRRVPVHLVEHGQLGLQGAASWYMEHLPAD
ncbi:glucokinase [Marilutibacter chinensis]|uniref:Glucokinase n=1 Tax=Marilutibacter chinensis TaxID=2912247 RepID=A0ABS9HQ91_9GAMM|nr:glucokinase [Lysobacter chinensis]MCF7220292.1 glucokinase [Lysobacter chinensis]